MPKQTKPMNFILKVVFVNASALNSAMGTDEYSNGYLAGRIGKQQR